MKILLSFFERNKFLSSLFVISFALFLLEWPTSPSFNFYQNSFIKLRSDQTNLGSSIHPLTKKECSKLEKRFLELLIEKNSLRFWLEIFTKYSRLNERETDSSLKKKYEEKEEKSQLMVLKFTDKVDKSLDEYNKLLELLFECLKLFGEFFNPYSIIKRNKSSLRYIDFY
ncbi:hypothetical protein FG386_000151 [Cryptosporidium ryanae]|uniref:uncharacterized protein n=1 Tax=Cryptosporidium ryanae TaxID=515981 RepID=UPI00351A61D1|nr:hypothetical protein FG386_000151 [Cryptosporidium ryanae]